jgi:hypothetical protein
MRVQLLKSIRKTICNNMQNVKKHNKTTVGAGDAVQSQNNILTRETKKNIHTRENSRLKKIQCKINAKSRTRREKRQKCTFKMHKQMIV